MEEETSKELALSDNPDIRRVWHNDEWYYAVIDTIAFLLPENKDPGGYWRYLKRHLRDEEGADLLLGALVQFKLKAKDGRFRLTDTCNLTAVFRLLQSIPSPRVEPFKLWLAQVGNDRIVEIENPEAAIERARAMYKAQGKDDAWIEERIRNDLIRNELTDEWKARGARDGAQFAVLTNEIHTGTFDISIQVHKKYKLLPARTNLRDHMTPLELALTSLGEATAITLHQNRDSQGFPELKRDATDAGKAGGKARQVIEETIGESAISSQNYLENPKQKQRRIELQQQLSLFPQLEHPDPSREDK